MKARINCSYLDSYKGIKVIPRENRIVKKLLSEPRTSPGQEFPDNSAYRCKFVLCQIKYFSFQNFNDTSCLSESLRTMSSSVEWNSQTNLLLVQLIYKYGDPYDPSSTSAPPIFEQIAHQLTNHSLVRPSKRKFTASVFYSLTWN